MKRYPTVFALVVASFLTWTLDPRSATAQVDRARQWETRYYRVWTDVEYDLARDICARMDAMYEEYARRFAAFTDGAPQHEKFEVRIFARREDYVRYTNHRLPNSAGIFMPGRNLLAAVLEGQGRDAVRRTLQHEAFHQFAHRVIGPNMPIWLNEGIAQVFEEAIWTGQDFKIGQVPPRRVRQLEQDVRAKRLIDFRKLLSMNVRDWNGNFRDRQTAQVQYNQAWAMAHFLIFATAHGDVNGEPLYRARVIDMLRRSRAGAPPDAAFVQSFSDNFAGFEQRFIEYARTLQPTLESAFIENQEVLADMLADLKQRGRTFDSIEAFRNELIARKYRMVYTRGELQWTSAEDVNTYFTDPQGRLMNERQLYFHIRHGAPLPDVICRALDGIQLRTRFHEYRGTIEHEVLIEPRR